MALFRLGAHRKKWQILKASVDPRVRSYVIHWLSPLDGGQQTIIKQLEKKSEVASIRQALVLMLGQFTNAQLPSYRRLLLIERLLDIYETEPDAGLHGAAEWLLRKWGQGKRLEAAGETLKCDETQV